MNRIIGKRIRALRKERGLSRDGLARILGLKGPRTVSAMETGVRRVSASELLLATDELDVPLEYFTDPFRLDGEAVCSWRQANVAPSEFREHELKANRWIAAYRTLAARAGRSGPLMRPALRLTKHSRFEDAAAAGERFVDEFELGAVPARRLVKEMEDRLGMLVLLMDASQGITAAACRLPEFDTVLIARGEPEGRRNFHLAHGLFRVLTWEAMPPRHVENANDPGGGRVGRLADSFAAAVLMPGSALESFDDCDRLTGNDLIARLNAKADELNVSSSALRRRLAALGKLKKASARAIPDDALRNNGGEDNSR